MASVTAVPFGTSRKKKPGFIIEIDGVLNLQRKLLAAAGQAENLRPAFKQIAENLRGHADRQFKSSGSEGGTPWKRLSISTLNARRLKKGYYRRLTVGGGRPLQATGRLQRSFTKKGRKHVETIGTAEMEWGSKHPLAHLHAKGVRSRGSAPPLPKREVISFKDEKQKQGLTVDVVRDHVMKGL